MESPRYSFCSHYYSIKQLDDWFNLTVTIKPESDLVIAYRNFKNLGLLHRYSAYFQPFIRKYEQDPHFLTTQLQTPKQGLVLWIVSHCHTSSRREDYVSELRKYINVDTYGSCASRKHPCDSKSQAFNESCRASFFNSYKFYLSFENSNCDYYITEKYWQFYWATSFFDVNIVPVVRGARPEQYAEASFGPTYKTHIHVDNFKSPRELADYLLYLDRNSTAYLEYFEWKKEAIRRMENQMRMLKSNRTVEFLDKPGNELFCEVCARLHNKTYMRSENNPSVKISELYNPDRDCHDQGDPNHFKNFLKKIIAVC